MNGSIFIDTDLHQQGYSITRYGGKYYLTFRDKDGEWVLDARGYYAGRVESSAPAWPGAFREPKSFTHKHDAIRFCRLLTEQGEEARSRETTES